MILTDSTSSKVGPTNVNAIASATAAFRHFSVYLATTISQAITGSVGLIKNGTGTLTLTGNNTYTGGTTVRQGTLSRDFAARSGGVAVGSFAVNSGATLNLDNTNAVPGGLLITNFVLTGLGSLTKTNTGSIDIHTGGNLTGFSGLIDVQGGALRLNNIGTNGNTAGATLNIASGALLDLRYDSTLAVDKLTGSGTLDHTLARNYPYLITIGGSNGSSQFDGVIQNTATSGVISLTKTGTGALLLEGNLTYTGATSIVAGTLRAKKTVGASTATATFTGGGTSLSVAFNVAPPSGVTAFQFFQGTTTQTYASIILSGVPVGTTATYTSATSTLAVTVP